MIVDYGVQLGHVGIIMIQRKLMMQFENPSNGYRESISGLTWLWALIFGALYFAYKGIWRHFVIGLILGIFTFGISWLLYPFFAKGIVVNHYNKQGWIEVKD